MQSSISVLVYDELLCSRLGVRIDQMLLCKRMIKCFTVQLASALLVFNVSNVLTKCFVA